MSFLNSEFNRWSSWVVLFIVYCTVLWRTSYKFQFLFSTSDNKNRNGRDEGQCQYQILFIHTCYSSQNNFNISKRNDFDAEMTSKRVQLTELSFILYTDVFIIIIIINTICRLKKSHMIKLNACSVHIGINWTNIHNLHAYCAEPFKYTTMCVTFELAGDINKLIA